MYIKRVEATVYDIHTVEPDPQHEYLVDTNAWYWITYTRASVPTDGQPRKYQSDQYPRFIKKALDKGALLHRCDLAFAELTHNIEDCERRIFNEFVTGSEMSRKEYRHSEDEEREAVKSYVEAAWGQVAGMSQCLKLAIETSTTTAALADFKLYRLDAYDIFLLQAMKQGMVTKIVTDDSDFATVPSLELFTCNPGLLKLADEQGKLRK